MTRIDPDLLEFPPVPPPTGYHSVDVLGTFVRGSFDDFHLLLSEDIAAQSILSLARTHEFDFEQQDRVMVALDKLLDLSAGDVVRPNPNVQLPTTVGAAAGAALRCATSEELRQPRVVLVVTEDPVALALGIWPPPGVPWHPESELRVLGPADFNGLVEYARRQVRRI